MPSPAKKRKLKTDGTSTRDAPPRGLEYFFAKQRENEGMRRDKGVAGEEVMASGRPGDGDGVGSGSAAMTDEELARKLQAEWDEEARLERRQQREEREEREEPEKREQLGKQGTKDVRAYRGPSSAQPAISAPGHALASRRRVDEAADESTTGAADTVTTACLSETVPGESLKEASGTGVAAPDVGNMAKVPPSLQPAAMVDDDIISALRLDENPLEFEPAKYIPALRQQWAAAAGGDSGVARAPYALLVRCFVLVSATRSRIKIVDTLVNGLRVLIEADPASLLPAVWLATNAIGPPYAALELGLGGAAIGRALRHACGLDARGLKALFDRLGDPGDVACAASAARARQPSLATAFFRRRPPPPLTIQGVYAALVQVAGCRGAGRGAAKQRIVDRLLQDARGGEESRYLVRTLCQHLRIGAVKTTMLIALARAFLLSRPATRAMAEGTDVAAGVGAAAVASTYATWAPADLARLDKEARASVWARAEEVVKACFAQRPNYDDLVPALLAVGVADADVDAYAVTQANAEADANSGTIANAYTGAARLRARCGPALHVPLRPMLGAITRDLGEMLTRLQGRAFTCEYKYDGQRAQVHGDVDGRVSIFSRHLETMTDQYPDLVALVPQITGQSGRPHEDGRVPVSSFVLEGEVVAVDAATGALLPFQTLTRRARKDVALDGIRVDVCLFAFDLLFLDGAPLLDRPLRTRRELLRSRFVEVPRRFTWAASLDATSDDGDAVSAFFRRATEARCEGIMAKILDDQPAAATAATAATTGGTSAGNDDKTTGRRRKPLLASYEPDRRLESWLKVKKDYGAAGDTLDLVPVAAWHGMGRKARWWSPILMAVRNEETGSLEAVTKCMSGFSDAFYRANRAFYDDGNGDGGDGGDAAGDDAGHDAGDDASNDAEEDADDDTSNNANRRKNTRVRRPGFVEYAGPEPDVWFEPQEVWEMAFADITLSPTYRAALGHVSEARGLSLRFPRFVRARPDKGIDDASTSVLLAGLYRRQEARGTIREGEGEVGEEIEEVQDEDKDGEHDDRFVQPATD